VLIRVVSLRIWSRSVEVEFVEAGVADGFAALVDDVGGQFRARQGRLAVDAAEVVAQAGYF